MSASVLYTNFGGMIVKEDRGGVEKEYIPDTLGSTSVMIGSTGKVTDRFDYWPYGEIASRTGNTPTPFNWVGTLGYYKDSATRFYVRMRSYLANSGGWMTVDPLWPDEEAYGYVGGRAVDRVDPSGALGESTDRLPRNRQPKEHGKCTMTRCDYRGFGGQVVATHSLFCFQTANPNKACAGDIYPTELNISLFSGSGCDKWATDIKQIDPRTKCYTVAIDCKLAGLACKCLQSWKSGAKGSPNYWVWLGCYAFGGAVLSCACERLWKLNRTLWTRTPYCSGGSGR